MSVHASADRISLDKYRRIQHGVSALDGHISALDGHISALWSVKSRGFCVFSTGWPGLWFSESVPDACSFVLLQPEFS